MKTNDIDFEFSAFRTQVQNKVVERSKNVIVRQIKIMTIDAKFSGDLWKKIIDVVAYLHNRTFRQSLNWKFSFEMFHDRKSRLIHLKIYECKIYAMTENVQKKSFAKIRISNVFRMINELSINQHFSHMNSRKKLKSKNHFDARYFVWWKFHLWWHFVWSAFQFRIRKDIGPHTNPSIWNKQR